ncbi:carboxypeptidase A1 [Nitratiruptor sp. YY08-26]|uniref:M14 family metallopeptidase n=1 Tax=unclassified Nitratiruptor TaxID=2624044 RepID=UPI001914DB7D|nr:MULTISPECIES: M14 family metallopeptidase [unclassified Nitratiruptor]BCD62310.1 carboxypeptidase A1 [Nitratiruptor sp. YY08-13]BCD66246.1 carboxypeptidase A1 [Nitratiruptor sp. YY08-26]
MKHNYLSYQDTIEFLEDMVKEYPHLIQMQTIGSTWENRPIVLATITQNVEFAHLKPALLYTGTIHAREWIGNELAVAFIRYLLTHSTTDPRVMEALSKSTLYIVPVLNPDGFEYSRTHYSFWRKNRRKNPDGSYGVDLNRNFSVGWVKSTNYSSNVYGGPAPFSEPETRAIKEFVDSHPNITIALDYHSQGNVFFPAHKFNHEAEIDGTDLNVLCANMNYEIFKVTGRKYGIHRGKPPTKLISGSGREYYYSKGILASVVEVGTRNIPDYLQNMSESIHENIPALLYALKEASNYAPSHPPRVEYFTIKESNSNAVTLQWEYDLEANTGVYFEIYRNDQHKEACREPSLIGTTTRLEFIDTDRESGKLYFYYIRPVNLLSRQKGPFAPQVKVMTTLERDEFFRNLFPAPKDIGYVAQKSNKNPEHFGKNSLFVGVNETLGISYGVIRFKLDSIATQALIKEAKISLYPLNRVNVKIEKYGEWSISIIENVEDITDFEQIHNAKVIQTLGQTIPSQQLTQGIWKTWNFNSYERELLQEAIKKGEVLFRIQGPTKLPLGSDSQMMMFDLGYGPFGGGIHYRPHLDIKYTLPSTKLEIEPSRLATVTKDGVTLDTLSCGFDSDGDVVYGFMEFDLSSLPEADTTVITNAFIRIHNKPIKPSGEDIRYLIELVDLDKLDYEKLEHRESLGFIDYEVSETELAKKDEHLFLFDTSSKIELENAHAQDKKVGFIIRPTKASQTKNHIIDWYDKRSQNEVKLDLKYIKRRKYPVAPVKDLSAKIEKGMVKLTWENPTDPDFVGAYVVRNRFHPPRNPQDGVKLYAGKDNYTYDNFGNTKIAKYYAVFTYDNVPNYSEPVILHYEP